MYEHTQIYKMYNKILRHGKRKKNIYIYVIINQPQDRESGKMRKMSTTLKPV
jgi:hypothetical protein